MQRFGTAVSVSYLSRRNPFRPMTATASLLAVAKALSTQLHRVPIVDEKTGKCVSILSQSLLIQFLNANKDELKEELRQTVGQLQLGLCKVVSVNSDASAWTAFKTLEVNSVSGIAIVDREGKLVGNVRATL
jgi:CBS domain-containing protein